MQGRNSQTMYSSVVQKENETFSSEAADGLSMFVVNPPRMMVTAMVKPISENMPERTIFCRKLMPDSQSMDMGKQSTRERQGLIKIINEQQP